MFVKKILEKKYKNQISSGIIKCTCCGELKPLENYYCNKGNYTYKCKSCIKKEYHEVRGKNKIKDISSGYVNCRTCGELKSLENYRFYNGHYNYECKVCLKQTYKKYQRKKPTSPERELFAQGLKTCNTCGEVKEFKDFRNKTQERFSPSSKCLLCSKPILKEKQKRYYEKHFNQEHNRERRREANIRYKKKKSEERRIIKKENNRIKLEEQNKLKEIKRLEREKILEESRAIKQQKQDEIRKRKEYYSSEEYKKKTKQIQREKHYERWKRRWNEDELFAMRVRLRNLIRNSFRKQGYKKFNLSTESIVGINYNEFKEHLESKFLEGMTWENRGEWHIDHIIPLSSSTSRDDLIRLCHYTNLQPLWAIDNMKKGNKIL